MAENAATLTDQEELVLTADGEAAVTNDDELVAADLLVEEISIDGMCGVY